jgi:hypothetical protein
MTYRRSRARHEFDSQLDQTLSEVRSLVATKAVPQSRFLAAYYVFAFAQLEVYVKSLVEDALQALGTAQPTLDKWPDLLLGYLLHSGGELGTEYRRFAINEDEGALLEKVACTARAVAAWERGSTPPIKLEAGAFLDKKKYPSPKNVLQLFRRLGIRNVWAPLGAASRTDAEKLLTSLNDLRTSIAHDGRVPTGFGLRDFRERLAQMKSFVAAVDRSLAAHFCKDAISRAAWNHAMT